MRLLLAFVAMSCAGILLAVSCSSDPAQETLCNPGDNIFCRCRGGMSGTKTCLPDGQSFGPCESALGQCDEIPSQGGNGSGASTGTGGEPPLPPPGELLGTCSIDQDCGGDMVCPMGYCTKPCASYEECAPPVPAAAGDCVQLGGGPVCMPYCVTQEDCAAFGPSSVCSWTPDALPAFDVVVCANWGAPVPPPDGFGCNDDVECNLGLGGTERVCQDGGCVAGCHQSSDCADSQVECSSSSPLLLGTCGGGGDPDACPGQTVSIAVADGQITLQGDTSTLLTADYTGTGNCDYSASMSTLEWIFRVTPAESGTLTALVQPAATFDSVLFARAGTCASGTQVACDDAPGDGASEIVEIPAVANQPIWIFVDGYDGSTGSFELQLTL